jgi:hypothetical protein
MNNVPRRIFWRRRGEIWIVWSSMISRYVTPDISGMIKSRMMSVAGRV